MKKAHLRRATGWLGGATVALLGACLGLAVSVAAHADERPSDIVYETPGEIPLLAPTVPDRHAAIILVTDDSLHPRRLKIPSGGTLAWLSYASHPSHIVFEREVARSIVCHSLVNFQLSEDQLRSAELGTGDVASFCELAPGTYRYKIVRDGAPPRPVTGELHLSSRLEGEIVVEPPTAQAGR